MSDADTQLDLFGGETPVEDLPEPQPEPGDSQIQADDPWPENFY